MPIKQHTRWRLEGLMFLMVLVLTVTGLINWLLPHDGAHRALRHLLRWIHEGAAIGFLSLMAAHLYFRSDAIRRHLRRFGLWGPP